MNPTVGELLAQGAGLLEEEARREAQVLLGHVLGVARAWLSANENTPVESSAADGFRALVERRKAGEPVAYLTGRREFYGLEFRVTPDVLIPRADTETLVDAALDILPMDGAREVLDLGTGSGCIAIAIAHRRPNARVTAVDRSATALRIAQANAASAGVGVEFLHGSWFVPLAGRRFDLIVSNPPYVATGDAHLRRGDLRFEPQDALASGVDGLDDIRAIVTTASAHLRPGGWLLLEHGYDQARACRDLLDGAGFEDLAATQDLAGIPRVAGGRLLTANSPNRYHRN